MKRLLSLTLAPVVFAAALSASTFAAEPGQVDFGKLTASEKGEFVEVNLGKGVLKLASVFARCKNPEAGQLIAGLSRVRVNVVGLDDTNRQQTQERVNALRENLVRDGWDPIATVRGKKQEDVAVYLKQRDGEIIDGIVVTVLDDRKREAVFVNIVGQIKAEQLGMLGEHLEISQLKLGEKVGKR